MSLKVHPAVAAYKANKVQYDQDYFLSFVNRIADANPHLEALRAMPEFKALIAKISQHDPFHSILCALDEMSSEDLQWLADNMPSGWPRARILGRIDVGTPV